ncbi:hypothetical protein C8R43DRAFT_925614 [Mycena crocata]|nr:hypothetical protein C8R43DRAFT_925614 [Mycena crocata]
MTAIALPARKADCTRLEDVEADIKRLKDAISLRMQRRLYTCQYPVLTLPNEIVSEIFLHFLPPYPECPFPTGLLSPTILTYICRKWRQIALTTPALWRAVPFPPQGLLADTEKQIVLESWLARSSSCPVSFKFVNHASYRLREKSLETLVIYRFRWEYMELRMIGDLLHIIGGPAPLLRELNLQLDRSSPSPVSLTDAPLLHTVILNDDAALSIVLPWTQLTSLTLILVYPSECTPILLQTCNLVHCELFLAQNHHSAIEPDVELAHLESLVITCTGDGNSRYLRSFIVPALQKLQVPETYLEPDPILALTSFISKSGCTLQEVRITGRMYTQENRYHNAFPLVSRFSFDGFVSNSGEEDGDEI